MSRQVDENEYVLWLQIQVRIPNRLQVTKTVCDLLHVIDDRGAIKDSRLCAGVGDQVAKWHAGALHDDAELGALGPVASERGRKEEANDRLVRRLSYSFDGLHFSAKRL